MLTFQRQTQLKLRLLTQMNFYKAKECQNALGLEDTMKL